MKCLGSVLQMMQASLSGLWRAGLMEEEVTVRDDTVFLGTGSALDSVAFVAFVADLEDRIAQDSGRELYIVLDEIHEFNASAQSLSAGALARFIVKKTGEEAGTHG